MRVSRQNSANCAHFSHFSAKSLNSTQFFCETCTFSSGAPQGSNSLSLSIATKTRFPFPAETCISISCSQRICAKVSTLAVFSLNSKGFVKNSRHFAGFFLHSSHKFAKFSRFCTLFSKKLFIVFGRANVLAKLRCLYLIY